MIDDDAMQWSIPFDSLQLQLHNSVAEGGENSMKLSWKTNFSADESNLLSIE